MKFHDLDGALFSRHGVNIQHEPDTYRKLSLVIVFSLVVVMLFRRFQRTRSDSSWLVFEALEYGVSIGMLVRTILRNASFQRCNCSCHIIDDSREVLPLERCE